MDCPICARVVMNLTPPNYDGLVVECPRCGGYRIMQSALADLVQLPIEGRVAVLGKAQSFTSHSWPTISKACLPQRRRSSE
jgi:hypothetical protein